MTTPSVPPASSGRARVLAPLAGMRRGQAIVLLAVIAAIVAGAAYSYREIDRELTQSALSRRAALSYLAAAVLTEKFDRLTDIGVSLASRVRFRELVDAGDWDGAIRILSGVPADFPFIDRITLNDLNGTMRADVPPVADVRGGNFAHRDWYQEVIRTGRPYISQVYLRAAAPQMNVFVAAVPIANSKGEMRGLLVLQVRSDKFFAWIAGVEVGPGGIVYVVDRRGMLAAHPKFSAQGDLIDYSGVRAVQQMLKGNRGVEVTASPVGSEELVVAYEPIPRHGWGVALEQPAATVFAIRDDQLRRVQIASGLILLFVVVVAYLASRIVVQHRRAEETRRVNAELLQTTRKLELEVAERKRTQEELASHTERLNILHEIDRAIIAAAEPAEIAEAALQRLRVLIGVPRAIVNLFDLAAGEAEWLAAVGRRRAHLGPGVRFSMELMGDVAGLRRGELQMIDVQSLPRGPDAEALLTSGVEEYMVIPMIAGGELIGGLSFGGARGQFPVGQVGIAREVATQLAIAIAQARLYERVKRQAEQLEQRVAERTAQLEATTHELEDLYNHSPCGYHSVDENGLIMRINDTELAWLGYGRDEVVGKLHHFDLMTPASAEYYQRETFPLFKRQGWLKDVEFSYVRKDGSIMHASINAIAVRDADGRYLMSRTTMYDITDRKRVEEALREREERLRLLVGAVKDYAIFMLDPQGRIVTWNEGAERINGYSAEEIIGQHISRFYPHEDVANDKPGHELQVTAAEGRYEEEGWRVRKDGITFWANVVISAVRDADGTLRGFTKVVRDLTQRKQAEERIRQLHQDLERRAAQLEMTNKELEGFSYSVSHDLRSPLRAIAGFSQMLEEDYANKLDDEGRRLLGVIRERGHRMGELIDDLLAFSRLGRRPIAAVTIDMNALVADALNELRPDVGPVVQNCVIERLPAARGDRALLRQVWVNLLSNALKFSGNRAKPEIKVSGRNGGAENVYSVSDNGSGFDMQYSDKLFGVFQRLHRDDEFEGTGVGLAIVQRVVKRHGGRVWAEGKLDAGATFYFSLPLGDAIERHDAS